MMDARLSPEIEGLLTEVNRAAHSAGANAWVRDVLKRAHRALRASLQPAIPTGCETSRVLIADTASDAAATPPASTWVEELAEKIEDRAAGFLARNEPAYNLVGDELYQVAESMRAAAVEPIQPSILPCDVMLPPGTIVRKGCSFSTLMTAIRVREADPLYCPHFAPAASPDAAQASGDPLAGLAERLDRLLLTSTSHGCKFVLATESAKNIVEIVREWIRTGAGYSISSTDRPSVCPVCAAVNGKHAPLCPRRRAMSSPHGERP